MADNEVNQDRPMLGNRHPNASMNDSADSIRRAGGEDPRRYDAKIAIDRVVKDNDMSGYNHNATSTQPANNGRENEMQMDRMDKKANGMGTPHPDGTYSR
jgi:hypothetical protein